MDEIKEALKKCRTVNDIFDVLDDHYDLDQQMGPISRSILIKNVPRIILLTGAKKKQWQEKQS